MFGARGVATYGIDVGYDPDIAGVREVGDDFGSGGIAEGLRRTFEGEDGRADGGQRGRPQQMTAQADVAGG